MPEAFKRLAQIREPTLWHFAFRLGADILERLTGTIETYLPNPRESITHVMIAGYHKGVAACVNIMFTVPAAPEKVRYEVSNYTLGCDMVTGFGSKIILEKLLTHDDDPLFAQYRPSASFARAGIDRAVEIARNAVRAHYDYAIRELDSTTCEKIGGEIRAAKITLADGFSPVPEIVASD